MQSLGKSLEREGIATVIRQNGDGIIYGITYVDHRSKSVFNGSDLGKGYSAKGIQERCKQVNLLQPNEVSKQQISRQSESLNQSIEKRQNVTVGQAATPAIPKALEGLLKPSESNNYLPHQLKYPKKKKRKRLSNNL